MRDNKTRNTNSTFDVNKLRILAFFSTIAIVITAGSLAGLYARGYRFDRTDGSVSVNGLLIVKSAPDGAQVYIDNELKTTTDDTISIEPGTYDVRIEKEGFITWNKNLTIQKEEVTEVTAHLFKSAPSLSPITLNSAANPLPSYDFTKLSYTVSLKPKDTNGEEKQGLWIMETLNLPLGFSRDPRRILDGDLAEASWIWSPNGREILLTLEEKIYLIPVNEFTSRRDLINIAQQKEDILEEWEKEKDNKFIAQIKSLPIPVQDLLRTKAYSVVFSPDEEMILYTASASATLADNLIKDIPGSSSQKQERVIEEYQTYVYDIEEDRNFLIDDTSENLIIEGGVTPSKDIMRRLSWFPTSRNLVSAETNLVTIMDYDGTNRQAVYTGGFTAPHAFPTVSLDRILILTNLGATDILPNLYSVSLK